MDVVQCAACGASNRPNAPYCMRCGKRIVAPDAPATLQARAFVERERGGPYFGAFPESLDFSVRSLAVMDILIGELWGDAGEAPGRPDWQPSRARLNLIVSMRSATPSAPGRR